MQDLSGSSGGSMASPQQAAAAGGPEEEVAKPQEALTVRHKRAPSEGILLASSPAFPSAAKTSSRGTVVRQAGAPGATSSPLTLNTPSASPRLAFGRSPRLQTQYEKVASYLDEAEFRLPEAALDAELEKNRGRAPSISNSIPLERAVSHGRDSVLEMDLADAAYEPTSAASMRAAGAMSLVSRGRHRRHRRISRHPQRPPSIASARTKKTVRSRAERAMRRLRRRGPDAGSDSSSSSNSSGSSSSSGIGWRFWRSSTASSVSDDSYIPPEPTFTLYTPRLAKSLQPDSSEQDMNGLKRAVSKSKAKQHPYTSKSSEMRDNPMMDAHRGLTPTYITAQEIFETTPSRTLTPCLDKLREFWEERDQDDSLGGDIGAAHTTAGATPPNTAKPRRDPANAGRERKTRAAGPAWWLDVQCPSIADMRQLRRVGLAPTLRFVHG